jgi:CheY-like chemotaxis protein
LVHIGPNFGCGETLYAAASPTDEALEKIRQQSVDAIVSDVGRPQDSQAGFTLLEKLRASGDNTPSSSILAHVRRSIMLRRKKRGAVGFTNRPDELF